MLRDRSGHDRPSPPSFSVLFDGEVPCHVPCEESTGDFVDRVPPSSREGFSDICRLLPAQQLLDQHFQTRAQRRYEKWRRPSS